MPFANISIISLRNLLTGPLAISLNLPDGGMLSSRLEGGATFTLPPTVSLDMLNRCADFHTLIDSGRASMTLQQGSGDLAGMPPEQQASPATMVDSCTYCTSGDIDLAANGLTAVDTGVITAGQRICVRVQASDVDNGIYIASTGAWTRAPDANAANQLKPGQFIAISHGTSLGGAIFMLGSDQTDPTVAIVPGVSDFLFLAGAMSDKWWTP
jgi:hypothetical protein